MGLVLEDAYESYQKLPNVADDFQLTFPDSGPIHEGLWWSTQTTHAPAPFHLGPCLAVICHELAWRGWKIDHHERMVPQVWAALIGGPSSGKSTSLRLYRSLYRDVLAHVEGDAGAGGTIGKLQRPDPFVDTEGTPQGLLEHLARFRFSAERGETHGVLFEEEFSQLIEADRKITEYLIKLADGESIHRKLRQLQDRAAKGEKVFDTVRNPRLSGAFSATESSMRRVLRPDHIEGGFFSRVFWLTAELPTDARQPFPITRPEQRAQTVLRWSNWLATLDGLEIVQKQRAQYGEVAESKLVELPEEVKAYYVAEWFMKYEREASEYDSLEATIVRLGRTIRMLAGVYALTRGSAVIDVDDMAAAIALGRHLLRIALKVSAEVTKDVDYIKIMKLLKIVEKAATVGIAKTELWQKSGLGRRGFKDVVDHLEELGLIHAETVRTKERGRPPTVLRTPAHYRKYKRNQARSQPAEMGAEVIPLFLDKPALDDEDG